MFFDWFGDVFFSFSTVVSDVRAEGLESEDSSEN